jgi:glycosyltransferase involved in cell wall biosynthesis
MTVRPSAEPPARTATVVLPARDEEAALPGVLSRVPAGYEALVVDNASTDTTATVAGEHGARVVTEPRAGYGAAVHAGLVAARTDVVCFLDADGSVDPALLPALVALLPGRDLVVGRRRPVSAAAWSRHARLANRLLAARVRRCTGIPVHDLAPVRVARRRDLLDLGVRDRRSGYPLELLVRAGRAGWRVREVDVIYAPRAAGTRSKVTGSVFGTLRAVRDMAAVLP